MFHFVSHLVKAAAYLLSLLSTICIIIPLAEGSMSLTVSLQQRINVRLRTLGSAADTFCLEVVLIEGSQFYLEVTSQDTNLFDTETT